MVTSQFLVDCTRASRVLRQNRDISTTIEEMRYNYVILRLQYYTYT